MSPLEARALRDGQRVEPESGPACPARLRTIDPLVMEFSGGNITISSPRLGNRMTVGPGTVLLLLSARAGIRPAHDPSVADVVTRLTESGFLMEEAEGQAPPESEWSPWEDWGVTAWSFHNRVRDAPFDASQSQTESREDPRYRAHLDRRPRPEGLRKPASDRILLLPRVRSAFHMSFREVLEGRRTHRHFTDRPLELEKLSDMLHYSFAPLRFVDAGELGTLQLRACASGGARHETEAFVCVFNVASVAPGLYHYDNIQHGLVPVRDGVTRAELEHITHGQGFFAEASFGVLTAASAERMSWKYPHPTAYRMLLQNVGHMAQVFSMTAAALGLGAAITGAIRETDADALLGLDSPREFTTFALACGTPVVRPDGLPVSAPPASVPPDYY